MHELNSMRIFSLIPMNFDAIIFLMKCGGFIEHHSDRIHSNRSYAQLIALLAVCIVKMLAVSTIVSVIFVYSLKLIGVKHFLAFILFAY